MKDKFKKYLKEHDPQYRAFCWGITAGCSFGIYAMFKVAEAHKVVAADILTKIDGTKVVSVWQKNGMNTLLLMVSEDN